MEQEGSQDSLVSSRYGLPLERDSEAGGGRGGFLILTNGFAATANDFCKSIGSLSFFQR